MRRRTMRLHIFWPKFAARKWHHFLARGFEITVFVLVPSSSLNEQALQSATCECKLGTARDPQGPQVPSGTLRDPQAGVPKEIPGVHEGPWVSLVIPGCPWEPLGAPGCP